MKGLDRFLVLALLPFSVLLACAQDEYPEDSRETGEASILQLNWLHDPTFAGHYLWTDSVGNVLIREGGTNISPIAEVESSRADFAIVGADIFLQSVSEQLGQGGESNLICISVDFQRNPVGWVMHPRAVADLGLADWQSLSPEQLNEWLFSRAKAGEISIGDKRGTETTAVWIRWSKVHQADQVEVLPVGFDASIVLSAPPLAYPVYLNEEPFKLAARIGMPVVVFDPATDGVQMYGNVVVTRRDLYEEDPDRIREIREAIRAGWDSAREAPNEAAMKVMTVYTEVDQSIVQQQVEKTLSFVYHGGRNAGDSDLSPGGRWDQTLRTLQDATLLSDALTIEQLKHYVLQ